MRVNITVPVYNEEAALPVSIPRLNKFLDGCPGFDCEIVIADNASTDRTYEVACALARRFPRVRVVHLELKGRGRALKQVWSESTADILSYMDVDLSTDLRALPPLIEALASGKFDLGTGSRLQKESKVIRGLKREFTSRCYNRLVKLFFSTKFSDAQCGFKAITREAAQRLLPDVEDTGWFFDTELLVLAEKSGHRIFDLPVTWIDDPDSRVKIIKTAWGREGLVAGEAGISGR
jgi:glycosyltransferase involved in cell wall biosynthesis